MNRRDEITRRVQRALQMRTAALDNGTTRAKHRADDLGHTLGEWHADYGQGVASTTCSRCAAPAVVQTYHVKDGVRVNLLGDALIDPCGGHSRRVELPPGVSASARPEGGTSKVCEGHPAGPYDAMGETVYCDGACRNA